MATDELSIPIKYYAMTLSLFPSFHSTGSLAAPAASAPTTASAPSGLSEAAEKKRLEKEKKQKERDERAAYLAAQKAKNDELRKAKASAETASSTVTSAPKFVNTTPKGEKKKIIEVEMAKSYEPPAVEAAWDAWWESQGFYSCKAEDAVGSSDDDKFVMVIPPPNVTGTLHIGHALTCSIEDTLTRWHRMRGKKALWVPGIDHAGIATQSVVERLLDKQGISKYDLGREKFLEKVWEYKNEKGFQILEQLRRLGASVDHSRTAFTMDEQRSKAVTEAFVRMFDSGVIYRATRLVNWSHALRTAISDIEVDYIELTGRTQLKVPGHDPSKKYTFGTLTSFAYKVLNDDETESGDEIVVATTRLETMLGDTAVAVHPNDARYKPLLGKRLKHPFIADRVMRVIADTYVDMEFGTGAVKITPAHDPNDFEMGKRHGLEEISILDDEGRINKVGNTEFAGLMRYDARVAIEKKLEQLGLLKGIVDNPMKLGVCSRSGDIIEPRVKPQWWVKCADMARRSVEAVEKGDLVIIPEMHKSTWYAYLGGENQRDWCISRQLWWGHRCPAYLVMRKDAPQMSLAEKEAYSAEAKNWVVGRTEEEALSRAATLLGVDTNELTVAQDDDVLDTWFSSGLFPFATMGWPDETLDMKAFFPNSLLETGLDILFFWVARMVMMSLQLTDKLPFKTVYLHAMVRDKTGEKMSKSKGNVIDPLEVIEGCSLQTLLDKLKVGNLPASEVERATEVQKKEFPEGIPECGADALRFGLLAYTIQGLSVNLDIKRVVAFRHFSNKLWQISRFGLMLAGIVDDGKENKREKFTPRKGFLEWAQSAPEAKKQLCDRDKWILSKTATLVKEVNECLEKYQFGFATQYLNIYFVEKLADVYVESIKPVVYDASNTPESNLKREMALNTLIACLDIGFKLLHPFMPFVTEELWQRLPGPLPGTEGRPASIMIAPYPIEKQVKNLIDLEAEARFGEVNSCAEVARSLIAKIPNVKKKECEVYLCSKDEATFQRLSNPEAICDITTLTGVGVTKCLSSTQSPPAGCPANVVHENLSLSLFAKGFDPAVEKQKIEKEAQKIRDFITDIKKKINPNIPEAKKKQFEEEVLKNEKKLEILENQLKDFA